MGVCDTGLGSPCSGFLRYSSRLAVSSGLVMLAGSRLSMDQTPINGRPLGGGETVVLLVGRG